MITDGTEDGTLVIENLGPPEDVPAGPDPPLGTPPAGDPPEESLRDRRRREIFGEDDLADWTMDQLRARITVLVQARINETITEEEHRDLLGAVTRNMDYLEKQEAQQ
jgi:hypothetical protein